MPVLVNVTAVVHVNSQTGPVNRVSGFGKRARPYRVSRPRGVYEHAVPRRDGDSRFPFPAIRGQGVKSAQRDGVVGNRMRPD